MARAPTRQGRHGGARRQSTSRSRDANHSSSSIADTYTGEPTGLVVSLEDGTTLYFAGDTNVFGDMALIRRLYEPSVAVLPIGDHYTMGPKEAAVALELLGVKRCVPCHWGTFGLLTGTPDGAARACTGRRGDRRRRARRHDRPMRERWLGSTGRKVDEIVIEGELDLPDDALVLDELDGDALREAFDAGRPVIVRAGTADEVRAALARPEVSCVVVPDEQRELLELDLRTITYG